MNKITGERVTHLICGGDGDGEPSDKIIYARGHNEDVRKGRKEGSEILIVWEEWYYDSLEFGGRSATFLSLRRFDTFIFGNLGRFPEEEYSITRPKPRRKTFVPRALFAIAFPPHLNAKLYSRQEISESRRFTRIELLTKLSSWGHNRPQHALSSL